MNNKQTEQLSKDIQLSILVSALLDIVFENKKGNLNKILSLLQKYDILNNDLVDYNYSEAKFKIKHLINSLLNDKNNVKTLTNKIIVNDDKNNKNNIIIYNKKRSNEDNNYNNNFIELENIGAGSYGSVYKVYHKYEKNLYAIKKVHITNELLKDNFDIFREIQLFSKLNHKNIVRYYSSWLDDSNSNKPTLYIQMELCESTFRDYLNNIREDESIEKRIFYFTQIVEGIKYLHDNDIIHRDIKPSNILFIDDTIKICDFGLARHVNNLTNIINGSSEVGTSFYRAPEIDTHIYNNKIDVYSLGIILIYFVATAGIVKLLWNTKDSNIFAIRVKFLVTLLCLFSFIYVVGIYHVVGPYHTEGFYKLFLIVQLIYVGVGLISSSLIKR